MGYAARDGSGDGRAHYVPRIVSLIDHVADANARLSLDPTGKVAGYQVIQDDDGLTYAFNGDGADAYAGLWVTLTGTASWNGAYTFDGSRYNQIGSESRVDSVASIWQMGSDYIANGANDYAWQAVWTIGAGDSPIPNVVRNPIASENNWSHP